jgi:hypothetical protein
MLNAWQGASLYRGWLDAVGTGGLALSGGLPVFQNLYHLYVRSGEKRAIPKELLPWSFRKLGEGTNRVFRDVHPEARSSFYSAFGITPDEQLAMEDYYTSMTLNSIPEAYWYRKVFID